MTAKSLEEKIELIQGVDFVPLVGVVTAPLRFGNHYRGRDYSKKEVINMFYMSVPLALYNTAFCGIIIETCKAIYG